MIKQNNHKKYVTITIEAQDFILQADKHNMKITINMPCKYNISVKIHNITFSAIQH